jgi:hypothetical protein
VQLAVLRPNVAACGHGIPMDDANLPAHIEQFASRFHSPSHGRYVREPALADEHGVVSIPPAPFDPVPYATAAGLMLLGVILGAGYLERDRD